MNQLDLFAGRLAARGGREPYRAFDAQGARSAIMEKLVCAGDSWVRRMILSRATGMRPALVGRVLSELCAAGVIERADAMPIIHPLHGNMGVTTGYRIRQSSEALA